MATPTWSTRELPILEAVLALEERDANQVNSSQLAKMTGLAPSASRRAFEALLEDQFVSAGEMVTNQYGGWAVVAPRLRGKGRRALRQWPADSYDALLAVLTEKIRDEPEPEARSKLEQLRDAIMGMGRDIATDVIAAAIKHAGGI